MIVSLSSEDFNSSKVKWNVDQLSAPPTMPHPGLWFAVFLLPSSQAHFMILQRWMILHFPTISVLTGVTLGNITALCYNHFARALKSKHVWYSLWQRQDCISWYCPKLGEHLHSLHWPSEWILIYTGRSMEVVNPGWAGMFLSVCLHPSQMWHLIGKPLVGTDRRIWRRQIRSSMKLSFASLWVQGKKPAGVFKGQMAWTEHQKPNSHLSG